MLTAIVGINWGDEGKGRMVDLISSKYDIVVRYQGGNNAGHTVINERGTFVLNLLPSGILRDNTVNVMGNGMVIDLEHLNHEIESLHQQGVEISPDNLIISDRATICMPYHKLLDILEEERLGDQRYGSTRRGIAPVYADKYMKKTLRMGDLLYTKNLADMVRGLVEWKNLTLAFGYRDRSIHAAGILEWLEQFGESLKPYISNTTAYLNQAAATGKNILFEAQLGALRDIDFGIYPYTTSSSTIAAYAPIGAGIPARRLDEVIGVTKAYSSCVGDGPFTAELFGTDGDRLREAGEEYGAATGRARRVGGFDVVATRYGVMLQGADCLALTKLDVLSYLERIPVCVAYEIAGETSTDFPTGDRLTVARPVYEYLEGFCCDISQCRRPEELPAPALAYIRYIEQAVGCPINMVSVGPERNGYIIMK